MSEDLIWDLLDTQFCSFKAKFEKLKLCKNEYNLTGVCNKQYCPLANGRYATIKEEAGVLYLNIKTIERSHTPAELWEKIALPEDLPGALAIINDNLAYWPKRFVNRVKERLVRLHQYIIRYRKYYYAAKPRLVTVHKKFERRDQRRELKALVAAKLDTQIKQELLERLKQGTYEFINIDNKQYMEILREEHRREHNALKHKSRTTGTSMERSEWKMAELEDIKKARALEREKEKAENGEVDEEAAPVNFVADVEEDEELSDLEDKYTDMNGEDEIEEEEEEEDEKEVEYENEGERDEVRADILKRFPAFYQNDGDDEELKMYKKSFENLRKRKLQQKHKEELKRSKEAQQKKKKYGAHVEIEYEGEQTTSTQSTTSR